MKFQYTQAIHKIRQMKSRIKVIPGGTSAGKTIAILAVLINKAIEEANITISVVSESTPHLRRGCLKDFLWIMKETNRYIDANYNRTNLLYTFTNGSVIEFFSVDDASKLRGSRRQILYINEANNINSESYVQLAMRTDKDIFIDFNPTHRFWAHDIENAEMLTLTYKDNSGLAQTVVDFLESKRELAKTSDYWANFCRVYLDGEVGNLEGVVYSNWSEIDKIPEEAVLIGSGLDFGFANDMNACVSVYKYNGKLVVDERMYVKGLSNSEISTLLKDVQGEIWCESAEPKTIAELKNYGHKVYPVKKGPDSILAGIQILQDYEMLVTRNSYNLKKELQNYMWKKDKDGNSTNSPTETHNDLCDALRYFALMKLGKKRNIIDTDRYFDVREDMSY